MRRWALRHFSGLRISFGFWPWPWRIWQLIGWPLHRTSVKTTLTSCRRLLAYLTIVRFGERPERNNATPPGRTRRFILRDWNMFGLRSLFSGGHLLGRWQFDGGGVRISSHRTWLYGIAEPGSLWDAMASTTRYGIRYCRYWP